MALSYATSTIVSDAFRQMELDPISSFAEDSEQATAAAEAFPEAMNQCLERMDWSFASKFVELSEAPSLPVDANLPFSYVRPGDLVRLIEVQPFTVKFRLDQDALRADQGAPLTIRYMMKITDDAKLPALFKRAVALRLAANLALRWTSSTRTKYLESAAEMAIRDAMRGDRNTASMQNYNGEDFAPMWADEALS